MKKIILCCIAITLFSCSEKPKTEFSLTGTTNEIKNGTKLYFEFEESLIDSAEVVDNTFNFQTKLIKSPMQVVLRTKDYSQYRFIWLENNPMEFDAAETSFKKAKIAGSNTQKISHRLKQKLDSVPRSERSKYRIEFVRSNPKSNYSAYLLSFYSTTWGKNTTKELYDLLSDENKKSEYGKDILKYIKFNKNPKVGDKYVDFEMKDTNGKTRKLSDVKDKLVLLEFWSSSCGPCLAENPNLIKVYEKYKSKGFEIFAVSKDLKKDYWLQAIKEGKLPWIQVSDLKRNDLASTIYGINGIPDNFLINEDGIIIGRRLKGKKLEEKLEKLLVQNQ